ncbi:MAG: hypothetical protein WAM39_29435 [Bryobacteraceae bacterium]
MQQALKLRGAATLNGKKILTLVVLTLSLAIAVARQKGWHLSSGMQLAWFSLKKAEGPDDATYKMLDAARAGDVKAYLNFFSGPLRAELAQTAKESPPNAFSNYLVRQSALLTGVAVTVLASPKEGESKVRLEYVYRDHSEVQDLTLHLEGGSWKIIRTAGSNQIKSLIRYGTIVTD